ncbi:hypothetical protein EDC04DRAFT_2922972 [Pisolithus marmoratus]|nr:hypothetical protein EDC04DRAFT_2922972 [Pisolithus marmoratus]
MAENKSGEEYVRGIAELAAKNVSEAACKADEAKRQLQQVIEDKARALCHETELTCEVERAKRRQQTIQAEYGTSRFGVFWYSRTESGAGSLDKARRETDRIQEQVKEAVQSTIEITETVKVTQAAVAKTTREAEESVCAARVVLEEAEERLRKGIQPIVIPTSDELAVVKTRVQYEQGRFHFAIAGVAGSGKSSFVNAIRGVDTQHQDAAEIGVAKTTVEIGAGTLQQPDWLYFNTQGLFVFDCVVVLFDNRFTQMDIAILTNCMRFQIPTYIVRSKVDIHIRNIMQEDGYDSDCDDVTMYTRATVKKNLMEASLPDQRVYIVSNKTLLSIVRDRSLRFPHRIIDELELIKDVLDEACSHRCGVRAEDDDCPV